MSPICKQKDLSFDPHDHGTGKKNQLIPNHPFEGSTTPLGDRQVQVKERSPIKDGNDLSTTDTSAPPNKQTNATINIDQITPPRETPFEIQYASQQKQIETLIKKNTELTEQAIKVLEEKNAILRKKTIGVLKQKNALLRTNLLEKLEKENKEFSRFIINLEHQCILPYTEETEQKNKISENKVINHLLNGNNNLNYLISILHHGGTAL